MTESEIAAEFDRHHANLGHMWGYDTAKGREQSAEAAFARCHAITGHGPGVPIPRYGWNTTRYAPQPAVPNRIAELEMLVASLSAAVDASDRERDHMHIVMLARTADCESLIRERDHALLRMEVAIATSNSLIDAEVQRRIGEAKAIAESPHQSPHLIAAPPRLAFPSRALRHQHQSGGLLSTADAGRVRLGGYAPSLPPR